MNKNPIIFIPEHVPSLKNTKQIKNVNGRCIMYNHPHVQEYIANTQWHYEEYAYKFYSCYRNGVDLLGEPTYEYPVRVGFHFVRIDKRKFDFHNALHVVADMMVKHNWIPDDDMDHFIPVPMIAMPAKYEFNNKWFSIYSKRPGVAIRVL